MVKSEAKQLERIRQTFLVTVTEEVSLLLALIILDKAGVGRNKPSLYWSNPILFPSQHQVCGQLLSYCDIF